MRHRLRNRIIIRCLSSGETGCALMPDDADVKLGVTQARRCRCEAGCCTSLMPDDADVKPDLTLCVRMWTDP